MSTPQPTPLYLEEAPRLPENIHFGTSSWVYPGWQGLVYHTPYKDEKALRADALAEYGRFPWFRTVGVDSSFYGPLSANVLTKYASQLPPNFPWLEKVWEEITVPQYATHPRYGEKAGKKNPNFLNAEIFHERILAPHEPPEIRSHAGPFIFQFQTMEPTPQVQGDFFERLSNFFRQLPKDFRYAVEIRNRNFLCKEYFDLLNEHGVTHCFNHWTSMPPLKQQMEVAASAGGIQAPFFVCRLLTPLNVTYENAVKRAAPYNRIVAELNEMRRDALILIRRALHRNVPLFLLANNRAEGCSPMTIAALGHAVVTALAGKGQSPQ